MSVSLQKQGNYKTMKGFFSFLLTHFSFIGAFLANGAGGSRRRLMERATWTNAAWKQAAGTARFITPYPSKSIQRPLSGAPGCIVPLSLTLWYFCPLLLRLPFLPHSPTCIFISIYLFSFPIPIAFSRLLFLPDILASCSSRQGVYSCRCEAESQLQR